MDRIKASKNSLSLVFVSCRAIVIAEDLKALCRFNDKLVGNLAMFLGDERVPISKEESKSKVGYEQERLYNRRKWAKRIQYGLAIVEGDAA